MEYSIDDLKSLINVNEKSISAFVLYLTLINKGESFVSPVGKITKLNDNIFKIDIDDAVIDKASSIILGDDVDFIG